MAIITVGTYSLRIDAEIALSRLREEGIEAMIASDDAGGLNPALGLVRGYDLRVRAEDEEAARAVLGET